MADAIEGWQRARDLPQGRRKRKRLPTHAQFEVLLALCRNPPSTPSWVYKSTRDLLLLLKCLIGQHGRLRLRELFA
jgi:hypothetical protein